MSPGATFERIYSALKDELGSGRLGAGEQLEPALLAAALNASITPVRDALHRLVGEGLVEAPRGDGFRTPLVTEVGLRNLYRWHCALVELGARARPQPGAVPAQLPADTIERTEALFASIASRSLNPEHVAAVGAAGERLRRARQAELVLLREGPDELEQIAVAAAATGRVQLRRLIRRYHRSRERLADRIVAALHGTG